MNLSFNIPNAGILPFAEDPTLYGIVWTRTGSIKTINVDALTPSYGSTNEPKLTVDVVEFGDGYRQLQKSGINAVRRVFNLTWGNRRVVIATAIRNFLIGSTGSSVYQRTPDEWFWWKPPAHLARSSSERIKVTCLNFRENTVEYNRQTITAIFEECFNP